jgi:hypothetical protein
MFRRLPMDNPNAWEASVGEKESNFIVEGGRLISPDRTSKSLGK